ncbi:MAG: hypothetical protein HYY01_14395 [Chloroflexi bacterium]|nr:hypothetical protein [Chloroflexota bacterium]
MMGLEMARLLATPDGRRMVETLKRLVHSQGLPLEEVVCQSVAHMERLEALAQRTGKTVRQVADESLDLYERHLERR